MKTSTVALIVIAVAGIVGCVVCVVAGQPEAGLALLAGVPALAVPIIGTQLQTAHETQTTAHVETHEDLTSVKTQLADVTDKVNALHNGALVPIIVEGVKQGLAEHLQTSSIVEEAFRPKTVPPAATVETPAPPTH